MFDLRKFILDGLLCAVGKMAEYRILLNAAGWHEKGVLSEGDLAMIRNAVEAQNCTDVIEV